MWLTLIVLPDGTEIFSGPGNGPKIQSATTKQIVNDGQELSIGSVCSAMFECTILNPGGELSIAAGDEITVYRVNGDTRQKVGLFTMEEPVRPSPNRYQITAYDRVSWLDKDLTDWLISLEGWPYTVEQLAGMVAHECGTGIGTELLLNGGYLVQRFGGSGITGRKIMQWIAEISASFCCANADGGIAFERYRTTNTIVNPTDTFSVQLADYQTTPVDRVQIRLSEDDIGVIYPDVEGITYPITGNYLLTNSDPAALQTVAKNIHNVIRGITYTPGTVTMLHNPDIRAGDIITVRDRNGKTATMYVMSKTIKGQEDTLECTGSNSRDSSTAVHEESFKAVNANMMELRKDVSGLNLKVSEVETRIEDNRAYADQKITEVTIAADGLASTVQQVKESVEGVTSQISNIQQTADSISLKVSEIVENGVDKVSTEFGMNIGGSAVVIARSGAETENRMDETGVYVVRSDGTVVMQAAKDGVVSQNLNVRGYLDVFGMLRQQAWTDERGRPCVATLWTGGN